MTSRKSPLPFAAALLLLLFLLPSVPGAQATPEPPAAPAPAGGAPAAPAPADVVPAEGDAAHDGGAVLQFDLRTSGQYRDVGGSITKFDEYGTVNEGLLLDTLGARYHRPASGHFLEIGVRNASQDDEAAALAFGRRGSYRLDVSWARMPHRFTGGQFLFGGFGTGRLLVPDVVQEQLQANEAAAADRGGPPPAGDPTLPVPLDLAQQSIVGGLYGAADGVTFGIERRRLGASFAFPVPLLEGMHGWVRVQNENRNGARVLGTGSYERWQNGAGAAHTIDRFVTHGAELAEPLDYRTLGASAGVGWGRETWSTDLEYTFTSFRNFEGVLRWDNPFRITDAAQVGSVERARFAVGQLVLPPDSTAHDVAFTAAADLPMHGRVTAGLSWGMITQDDAFYPYTLNSAIIATDLGGTAVGPASTAALPASDLGGDVRTLAATLAASVRPLPPLGVTAKYRAYRYDGRSDEITFPGYAAFGESAWRRERNDVTSGLDAPVANEVFDYWRHEAELGADYRVSRLLSVALDGGWEGWRYDHLRVDATDEWSMGAGATLRPMRNTSLRARYRFSDRSASGYLRGNSAANPEARGLMNYNWADRRRHLADVRAQWAPTGMLSVGITGRVVDEAYDGETEGGAMVDAFRFGRTDVTAYGAAIDVTVTPLERLSLQASWARDRRKESMANVAKDDPAKSAGFFVNPDGTPLADNYSPVNYWNSDITDVADTLGVGATFDVLPRRVVLDARYDLSFSDVDVDTWNPNPIDTGATTPTLANGVANDWPTVKSRLHEITLDLGWRMTPKVKTGVRYLYASYDLDDWAWEIMAPYMAGRSAENSTRYVFAQAVYDAYEAHVATVYLAGSF